jgi:hypothetical protein
VVVLAVVKLLLLVLVVAAVPILKVSGPREDRAKTIHYYFNVLHILGNRVVAGKAVLYFN